ncbi:MAG: M20/M25/M40 family metallo-hydrolase [Planctomycetes bacterium]|nr:M20/M25/M40 family metallo-hydrolase [Planctomycetota bacterium]
MLLPPAAAGGRERRDVESAYAELGALGLLAPGSRDGRLTMTGSWERPRREGPLDVRVLYDDYVALRDELEAGAARELELDVRNAFVDGPVTQYNVVADLVGRERPDEYVLVQGHIDAFDGAQGACDNGTGVATTLEAARLLASLDERPRRTIRFVLYSGEEQGLYGSRGYVRDHADELERVSVVLNHDNGTNYLAGIGPTLAMLADFEHVFAPVQALDPERPFALRVSPGLTPGPSDHAPFVEAGVPAFHWDQSQEGYRRLHHTQHDTLAEVDDADQRHSARVIALAAWRFAELDHLVDRTRLRRPEPRRMGVYLAREDSRVVENVVPGGLAEGAGWRVGDVIVAIDGMEVQDSKQIAAELQKGGPQKRVVLERGAERVESVLDYTDDPQEAERRAWEEEPAEAR